MLNKASAAYSITAQKEPKSIMTVKDFGFFNVLLTNLRIGNTHAQCFPIKKAAGIIRRNSGILSGTKQRQYEFF